jgi:hypothetical protein
MLVGDISTVVSRRASGSSVRATSGGGGGGFGGGADAPQPTASKQQSRRDTGVHLAKKPARDLV